MEEYIIVSKQPSIVIVESSKISMRLDAGNYRQDYLVNRDRIRNSIFGSKKLVELLVKPSFRGRGFPENPSGQDPVIKVRNVTNYGITGPYDYIDATGISKSDRAWARKGDVLLTVTGLGSSGKADLFFFDTPMLVDGHVAILRCSSKCDAGFLKAFLSSSYGQKLSEQDTIGSTGQIELYGSYIDQFDIPYPDHKIQAYIGDKVRLAERCREEAGRLIEQAKADLVSTFSFDLYTPPSTSSSSGSGYRLLGIKPGCILVESVLIGNSLLPTRYQAQYLDRDMLLVDHGLELISLEDIASGFINGFDCRDFKSSGTPYLRVGNICPNELDLSGVMYIEIQPTSLPKKFHLTSGDLLITRKGSYGFCTSVTKEMEQMVFSSEIIRVPLHKGWDADYIALFLNSPYGRYQFDRLGTGTTMKGINHENLADIKVPEVSYEAQKIIGGKVRLSMALNEKSKDLISEACRDVEDLIDAGLVTASILSGEMQAPTWNEVHQNLLTNLSYA